MAAGTQESESTDIVEIIVIGLTRAGKTTFIKTISHDTQWHGPQSTGWLFGRLAVDENLMVHFLEPPAMSNFDFMQLRELISNFAVAGYIVLMDSTRVDSFGEAVSILQMIRAYHGETPVVVAANKQDAAYAWNADDIRMGLSIPEDIPVVPCVSTSVDMVKEAVLQLLYRIFGV